ncbi:MAG: hypothetical protein KDD58_14540, partial [Bdellovibrionales bacterium]|nr:hypothetical protein [Bdellovibrionales bacterium]
MKTVKWISFISTIFVFILSAFLLNRLSNENHCNEHPSISQLNVFIKGRILEIPNCDWYENISQPLNMNSDVKAVITLTQKLPKTKTPFILTIDMDKKQNFRSILNYFWVGQEILYKHIELGIWLKQKSFNYYSGKNESRLINRSLNILSMKVLEGVYPLYNWASKSNLQIEHLSKVLMTHQESCSHYLWDLENLESCKQKVISIKSLSKAPIEILLSNSLFSYYKKLDLKTKVKFSRNLKLVRQKTNFSNLDIIINNKITYNQLVDQYVDLT